MRPRPRWLAGDPHGKMVSGKIRRMFSSHQDEPRVEAVYRKEHEERPALLSAPEHVDLLINELFTASVGYNLAVLYSRQRPLLPKGDFDHQVMVGVKRGLGVGVMRFSDASGTWVTVRTGDDDGVSTSESVDGYVSYSLNGHSSHFLDSSEIRADSIRRAVKEFLATGGRRPTCVEWQDDR